MEKRVGEDFPRDPPKTILTNWEKNIYIYIYNFKFMQIIFFFHHR